jgi:hypothetical protein
MEPVPVAACRVFPMRLIRTLREWWQAGVAALGGANQMTMREAYRHAYEKPTPAPDTPQDDDDDPPHPIA